MRVLGKLANLTDNGIKIHYFVGNHDLWMRNYFETELGISVYHKPMDFTIDDTTFFIGHGDGLGPNDKGYKLMKKIFVNPLAKRLYQSLHPAIGMRLGHYFSVKNKLIYGIIILLAGIVGIYSFDKYQINKKKQISDTFNLVTIEYSENNKEKTITKLIEIINEKDPTYSPLSLYFIIDNELISDQKQINELFDILIDQTSLDDEIKNLVIYKKALFNADQSSEGDLLNLLNPLINSKSVWKSHALYLMAEYFYAKDQNQKAKEFFNQIISLENPNPDIRLQADKRLNRDLSE